MAFWHFHVTWYSIHIRRMLVLQQILICIQGMIWSAVIWSILSSIINREFFIALSLPKVLLFGFLALVVFCFLFASRYGLIWSLKLVSKSIKHLMEVYFKKYIGEKYHWWDTLGNTVVYHCIYSFVEKCSRTLFFLMCRRLKMNPQGLLLLFLLPEQQSNTHLNICQCKYQFTSRDEFCAESRCH